MRIPDSHMFDAFRYLVYSIISKQKQEWTGYTTGGKLYSLWIKANNVTDIDFEIIELRKEKALMVDSEQT